MCLYLSACTMSHANTVYITIDDSPLNGFDNVLSALEEEKAHATLFLVGEHVELSTRHQEDLKRAQKSPYIFIGNHSYSHAHDHYRNFYADTAVVIADMKRNNRILGFTASPYYARLPGRDVFRLPELKSDDPFISPAEDKKETVNTEK